MASPLVTDLLEIKGHDALAIYEVRRQNRNFRFSIQNPSRFPEPKVLFANRIDRTLREPSRANGQLIGGSISGCVYVLVVDWRVEVEDTLFRCG